MHKMKEETTEKPRKDVTKDMDGLPLLLMALCSEYWMASL